MARALIRLSEVARDHRELPAAISLARQGLDLYQEVGDQRGKAHALVRLALMMHHQGDHPMARALLEQGLAIGRELGDKPDMAWALISLGDVLRCLEEYQAAEAACQESLDLWQELGDEWSVAGTLNSLGVVARHRGDHPRAIALFKDSLQRYRDLSHRPSIHRSHQGLSVRSAAISLIGLAGVALRMKQAARAACSLGAAEALLESVGARPWPAERFEYERNVAAARAALGETAFVEAWSRGRQTPMEQALAEALALTLDGE
jgi:tetratricopeptide (TPR) repeat protein